MSQGRRMYHGLLAFSNDMNDKEVHYKGRAGAAAVSGDAVTSHTQCG